MKKLLCIVLVCMMIVSVAAVGVVTASAHDGELAPGGFGMLGEYTPSAGKNAAAQQVVTGGGVLTHPTTLQAVTAGRATRPARSTRTA